MSRKEAQQHHQLRCPTCDILVDAARSKNIPFCSERCRLIDLGRWLNEEIAVICDRTEEEEEADLHPPSKPRLPPGWHDA